MQVSIVDNDVLVPVYFCDKKGESIDVQEHGVDYTVWKLLDDFEKHTGKSPKISCKRCNGQYNAFKQLIATIFEVGEASKNAASQFQMLADALNNQRHKGKE